MSYHGKIQTLLNGTADAEIQAWAAEQLEKETKPLYTTPQIKELSDEEINKAFEYYCESDEGVLRFDYELREEWKKEQLIRWKEAFAKAILKKASEK